MSYFNDVPVYSFPPSVKQISFKSDVESMKHIRHENIMKLYGCFQIYEDLKSTTCSMMVVDEQPDEDSCELRGSGLILEKMDATLFDVKFDYSHVEGILSEDILKKMFLNVSCHLLELRFLIAEDFNNFFGVPDWQCIKLHAQRVF